MALGPPIRTFDYVAGSPGILREPRNIQSHVFDNIDQCCRQRSIEKWLHPIQEHTSILTTLGYLGFIRRRLSEGLSPLITRMESMAMFFQCGVYARLCRCWVILFVRRMRRRTNLPKHHNHGLEAIKATIRIHGPYFKLIKILDCPMFRHLDVGSLAVPGLNGL